MTYTVQNEAAIAAKSVTFDAGGQRLLDIDSLAVNACGPTLLLGPNGAGKSLCLRVLHGLIAPTTGRVTGPDPTEQAMVFQQPVLLRRSVLANVTYALAARGVARPSRNAEAQAALRAGGLDHKSTQSARSLSGGEAQRLALVRALACKPKIIFLDEPTSHLDPASTQAIEAMILRASETGTKIIMVTHDLGQARRVADDVVFLHRGKVTEHTTATTFFDRPTSEAGRAYLTGGLVL